MDELLLTAIHEAGHAAAFLALFPHRTPYRVTIVASDDARGYFEGARNPRNARDSSIVHAAGYAALIVAGYPEEVAVDGCDTDFERIRKRRQPLARAKEAATALLREPRNAAAVERLTAALLQHRTLSTDDILRAVGRQTPYEEWLEECRYRACLFRREE